MVNTIKRRGLSDVVTTVLIILLVLAAVAIIWGYLRGALQQGGQQITSACITLDLKPISCNVSAAATSAATVTYGRNSGVGTLTNVTLVFTAADGTTFTAAGQPPVPGLLETKVYHTPVFAANVKAVSVAVAGTVTTESGAAKLCDRTQTVQCTI